VPSRLAVALAMVVFAVCVTCGMLANNSFAETLRRALLAMLATLVLGLIVGAMAQKMLDENLKTIEKNTQVSEADERPLDR